MGIFRKNVGVYWYFVGDYVLNIRRLVDKKKHHRGELKNTVLIQFSNDK